jgi:hypothetical protein
MGFPVPAFSIPESLIIQKNINKRLALIHRGPQLAFVKVKLIKYSQGINPKNVSQSKYKRSQPLNTENEPQEPLRHHLHPRVRAARITNQSSNARSLLRPLREL